jgi:hypothetical protein
MEVNGNQSQKKDLSIIKDMIVQKENRFKAKGFGLVFAYLELVLFVVYMPEVMKIAWPRFLVFMNENNI